MKKLLTNYRHIISLSIPALIAIIGVETINVIMYAHGPLSKNESLLPIWLIAQTLSGFVFAYISDKHFRKTTLIISQAMGVLGSGVLFFIGLDTWAIILIALIFNPLPVARAALLDNFPQYPSLRLIGFTFFVQYIPWFLFSYIAKLKYENVLLTVIVVLGINVIFMMKLFKDKYDSREKERNSTSIFKLIRLSPVTLLVIAFIFSESVFYFMWDYVEYLPKSKFYFSPTTLATLSGIAIAILYPKLPHISIITICYFIGLSMMIVSLYLCFSTNSFCDDTLIRSITLYAIPGGIYLPFVTDGAIGLLGKEHKAVASALIEFGGTTAALFTSLLNFNAKYSPTTVIIIFILFLLVAAIVQKYTEKHHFSSSNN